MLLLHVVIAVGCAPTLNSQLIDSVRRGDAKQVDELIAKGANANCADTNGVTALILAYECENLEVFVALLKHNANPNTVLPDSRSAMHMSATNANPAWLKHAIESGGNVNLSNSVPKYYSEMTPLFYAVGEGRIENIRLLLENGASIDHRRAKDRQFPLLHAAAVMRYDAAYELLIRGANYEQESAPGGQTLAKWLRKRNSDVWVTSDQREHFHKVWRFLIERGVDLGPFDGDLDIDGS